MNEDQNTGIVGNLTAPFKVTVQIEDPRFHAAVNDYIAAGETECTPEWIIQQAVKAWLDERDLHANEESGGMG